MKYETKDVNKFFNCIWDIISPYTTAYRSGMNYCRTIGFATLYLSACSALKNNHDSISFEDVITGYLTIFKLFYIDIRPLVKKGYANYRGSIIRIRRQVIQKGFSGRIIIPLKSRKRIWKILMASSYKKISHY